MAEDKKNRSYVNVGVIGYNYDNTRKQTLASSIEKTYRMQSLKDEYFGEIGIDYIKAKQQKLIEDLSDEPQGPQIG